MSAPAPAPASAATVAPGRRVFRGWYVVAAAFVVLMTSAGLGFYGLSVYLEAITDEQGFSTSSVSAATSVFFIVTGVSGRFIGQLITRRDVRQVVVVGGLVAAMALAALGQVEEVWQVFVVYAVFGVGFAATAIVPCTTVVTRWFHRRRSVALSIASTGLSVGGLTLTKVASWLIDRESLSGAMPWLGVLYALLAIPAGLALLPDPARRGLRPDGDLADPQAAPVTAADLGVAYDVAVRSRFFRAFTGGFVLTMGAQVGAIAQMTKVVTERTGSRSTGALAVSALALASVVARLAGGAVMNRLPMAGITAALAVVQGTALLLLSQAGSEGALLACALLFGATVGNLLMLQPLILAEAFGVRDYPRVFSLSQLIVTAGIASGPFLLGALRDASGYGVAFLVGGTLSILGGAIMATGGSVRSVHTQLWSTT